jgi:arylsulfatase A-like enzyme
MNNIKENNNKMNLLIIMPDQMRADYLGCYGHSTKGTKNIDRLATEGLKFDNC